MEKDIQKSLENDVRKLIDKYESLLNYREDLKHHTRVYIVDNIINTSIKLPKIIKNSKE